jgi:hypothetical protein
MKNNGSSDLEEQRIRGRLEDKGTRILENKRLQYSSKVPYDPDEINADVTGS